MPINKNYIGRFAPSPTGPLHLGSLYTALASYLHAKANQGKWLLRIDDLDRYRNTSGATESIIDTLQIYGLHWDGVIQYQTDKTNTYQAIINNLQEQGQIYPCICTRKSLTNHAVYPGTCLKNKVNQKLAHALRIKTDSCEINFDDEIQGTQCSSIVDQHGDFIIKRKDTIIAYQLAVVIDDYKQNISHVVRGYDLLDSTPKQIFLQQQLGYPTPVYCHVPIITDSQGCKLSKQAFAQAVCTTNPEKTLYLLLQLLKQNPSPILKKATVKEILDWATNHWKSLPLKKIRAINSEIY